MGINREFSKDDIQITGKYLFKILIFLPISEMWIRTTLRYHYIPVRITEIFKMITSASMDGEKEKYLVSIVGECKLA